MLLVRSHRRGGLAAVCLSLSIGVASTALAAPPRILAAPLRIMVEDGAAPNSRADGTGFANDLVLAAYSAVNVAVKLEVVPYARCKASVMAGSVAACFSMSWAPELSERVRFPDQPLFESVPRFFRKLDAHQQVRSEAEIPPGAIVGLVNGYEYPRATIGLEGRGVHFDYANSEILCLRKVAAGRIDFAVFMASDIKTSDVALRNAAVFNVVPSFDGESIPAYIGFSLIHPQGTAALRAFNEGFALIQANGVRQQVVERWRREP